MNFLKKLFGKKPPSDPPKPRSVPTALEATVDTSKQEDLIKLYDAYGREMLITKKEWRDKVLLGNLENVNNDPNTLYSMIAGALEDGFAADIVKYAEHLQRTDPIASRGAVLLGVVYLELNRLDEAERTLRNYLDRYGDEGYVLTNLAKVFSKRGDSAKAEATLWRGLEVDPNQENAVGWYWIIARDRDGDEAGLEALRKISRLAGSWRAQLWLARTALERKQKEQALKMYEDVLRVASRPVPVDLLKQMSGDLGNHGHLVELLKLTQPHFEITVHGLDVGNNMIKANVDLGRVDHAHTLLDQLYALKRPDYQQTLAFWDTEIAKARIAHENELPQPPPSVAMLTFEGPIWLPTSSRAASLFPSKDEDAVVVCFLGATVETGETGKPYAQLADVKGRITRALTLFLSEQLHLRSDARGQAIQPWVLHGGFVLSGQEWESEFAIDQAKGCDPPGDYIVVTHLVVTSQPQAITFRLIRCIDGSLLDSGSFSLEPENVEPCFRQLADKLLASLCQQAQVEPIHPPFLYQVPQGPAFSDYQLRLEQALAVRASGMDDTRPDFLTGAREIILGNIHLCLTEPQNVSTRILLAETLARMKKVHPQVIDELRDKVQKLQKENPLTEPAQTVIEVMLAEVLSS